MGHHASEGVSRHKNLLILLLAQNPSQFVGRFTEDGISGFEEFGVLIHVDVNRNVSDKVDQDPFCPGKEEQGDDADSKGAGSVCNQRSKRGPFDPHFSDQQESKKNEKNSEGFSPFQLSPAVDRLRGGVLG